MTKAKIKKQEEDRAKAFDKANPDSQANSQLNQ